MVEAAGEGSELLASYEKDLVDCLALLTSVLEADDKFSMLDKNQFALDNARDLLKQMEIEAMNFMDDSQV